VSLQLTSTPNSTRNATDDAGMTISCRQLILQITITATKEALYCSCGLYAAILFIFLSREPVWALICLKKECLLEGDEQPLYIEDSILEFQLLQRIIRPCVNVHWQSGDICSDRRPSRTSNGT
jgi:hypothetical protein